MDVNGALAFVYAKASGDLGKSFVGEKANRLFEAKTLSELWTLVFPSDPIPMVPEVLLAKQIEETAFNRFVKKFTSFIDAFDKPEDFLSDQLKIYEVENLKSIVDSLCSGEHNLPSLFDIGKYNTLHIEAWPDIGKITEGTSYSWLKTVPGIHEQQEVEYKLDIQIIKHIWDSCKHLGGEDGKAVRKFIEEEFSFENIIWALRLKINFALDKEDVLKHLMYVSDKPSETDPVCFQALKVIEKDPENISEWENWKYKDFVNPKTDDVWKVDPAWIEKKYNSLMGKKASVLFHGYPVTCGAIFGWFKLKQYELALIRKAVECLRLNVNISQEI